MPHTILAAASLALLASAPVWVDPEPGARQFGFDYCSAPVIPGCIARTAIQKPSRLTLQACNADVLRFTQSLGAYRACLTRESERAIGAGNAAITRFRCIAQGGRRCE